MFELVSDILLIVGSAGLAIYCIILSKRLKDLSRNENGLGLSIATLSERVENLASTTAQTNSETEATASRLAALIEEAERYEGELSFLLAGSEEVKIDGNPTEHSEVADPEPIGPSVEPIFTSRAAGQSS